MTLALSLPPSHASLPPLAITALYRLVEPLRATPHEYGVPDPLMAAEVEGSKEQDDGNSGVYIDGVRTFNVPLPWLRSNMSIIPQDPWLSNGTVRYNLGE